MVRGQHQVTGGKKRLISPPCRHGVDSSVTECHPQSWVGHGGGSPVVLPTPLSEPHVPVQPPICYSAGCLFSLSPAPLSFQTSLSCPEVTQRMAMMMPGRFLTLGKILPLGRETGKSPGCQRREQGPGMHPEVRGKDSTAGSWGAIPAASELLPY